VAKLLPDSRLFILVWIVGALYALLGANAFAELATMIPESGGHTVFVRRAMGSYAGFVIGWSDWLSTCGSMAIAAIVIGESARAFFAITPLATSSFVILAFALVQLRGVKLAGRTQEITALAKTAVFVGLVIACFVAGNSVGAAGPVMSPPGGFKLFAAVVLSMQAVIFTYDGYYGAMYFSEEVKNPARDLPRSIFGGVAAVTAIYLLVNLGFLRVLGVNRMAGDPLVAASAAGRIFGPAGDSVIRVLTIVSLLSAVLAFQMMASRVLYRLGTRGFVRSAALVNPGGTPTVSLLASTAVTLAMIWTGTFEKVLALTAFFFVAQYALDFASLLVLRRTEPDAPRPFRARGHPWTTGGVFLISVIFLAGAIAADTRNSVYSLVLLAVSYPVFRLVDRGGDTK
jgi:APA family basic amino acid/polyamine antiporter